MTEATALAKRLLEALDAHARQAIEEGVPRAIYLEVVSQHAGDAYDRMRAEVERDEES